VLLESGIAASSLSWAAVQPSIATFSRVCAYDRTGLAWSEASSRQRTFDGIVTELGAVLERTVPGEQSVLVGHSFGSFVVSAYAMRFPQRVAGIVLVDPAMEWLTVTAARTRLLRGARHLSRVGGLLAHMGVVRACLALLTGGAPAVPRRFTKLFGPAAAFTLERLVGDPADRDLERSPGGGAARGAPTAGRLVARRAPHGREAQRPLDPVRRAGADRGRGPRAHRICPGGRHRRDALMSPHRTPGARFS
jgi:pimeloyl-ACP methyl ester carboxylesterase